MRDADRRSGLGVPSLEESMIVLAILCLAAVVAVTALMLTAGVDANVTLSTPFGTMETKAIWIFVAGALTLMLAEMALSLMRGGTRRKVERRRELRRLRQVEEQQALEDQNRAEEERIRHEQARRETRETVRDDRLGDDRMRDRGLRDRPGRVDDTGRTVVDVRRAEERGAHAADGRGTTTERL